MQLVSKIKSQHVRQSGFTLQELMVSLLLSAIIFSMLIGLYSNVVTVSQDTKVRMETLVQAQAILQTIGNDIRVLGNGVPFDQSNFQIGEATLLDPTVSEPIDVATATATSISFRLNETGEVALLTATFDPTASLDVQLTGVDGLQENDPIYITNSMVSGDDGFYGIVTAVDAGTLTVTLDPTYSVSPGATFDAGSVLEEVPMVTIASGASGITRNSGYGEVLLGGGATMALEYLDENGTVLGLPISDDDVINSLRAIRVSVTLTSTAPLRNGTYFQTTAQQTFGLRNLNYVY